FIHHILSMNVYDHLFWMLAAICVVKIIKEPKPQYWIWLGIILGIGLQNKISMIFFIIGFGVGLLLTEKRKLLLTPWPWIGGLIAFLIFLPNIFWQMQHDFPTLEFMRNAQQYKITPMPPGQFWSVASLEMHPLNLLILLLGLIFLIFHRAGRPYLLLGWIFATVALLLMAQRAKPYYLSPAYPIVIAGGAIALEIITQRRGWQWARSAIFILLLIGGALVAPMTLPVLSPEQFIRYQQALGMDSQATASERHEFSALSQHYADQFGWEEMVIKVAEAYNSLTPEEQAKCVIYGDNYGEAGAVDFLGKKYGLPRAISRHNSYYLWGYGDADGSVIININNDEDFESLLEEYESVERCGSTYHPYAMPYENHLTIFICRKMRRPLAEVWASAHVYI
ncbi:MAG TPA: glycosyltransferase family 39 protein, partial [bacterium]